jgi:hypothetical protein
MRTVRQGHRVAGDPVAATRRVRCGECALTGGRRAGSPKSGSEAIARDRTTGSSQKVGSKEAGTLGAKSQYARVALSFPQP